MLSLLFVAGCSSVPVVCSKFNVYIPVVYPVPNRRAQELRRLVCGMLKRKVISYARRSGRGKVKSSLTSPDFPLIIQNDGYEVPETKVRPVLIGELDLSIVRALYDVGELCIPMAWASRSVPATACSRLAA